MLPHVSGRFSAVRQKINLEAFGFTGFTGLPLGQLLALIFLLMLPLLLIVSTPRHRGSGAAMH